MALRPTDVSMAIAVLDLLALVVGDPALGLALDERLGDQGRVIASAGVRSDHHVSRACRESRMLRPHRADFGCDVRWKLSAFMLFQNVGA